MENINRIVLIGNGFDLAHGLKTTYKDFIDWYMCGTLEKFSADYTFEDKLFSLKLNEGYSKGTYRPRVKSYREVLDEVSDHPGISHEFNSVFFKQLVDLFDKRSWVNIECQYFEKLKEIFNKTFPTREKNRQEAQKLNSEFDCLIDSLTEYFIHVNSNISKCQKIAINSTRFNLQNAFKMSEESPVTFINFNYTDTLQRLGYASDHEVIHIHGRASEVSRNPIIFGYGDQSDPIYQSIEDSGMNDFLDHIKAFSYLRANNYKKVISLIDSRPYKVYVVGHSCGLSDRILLREIFENDKCEGIEVFFHDRADGSNNYKETTQEISRHFKPQNKGMMLRKVGDLDSRNSIPQTKI